MAAGGRRSERGEAMARVFLHTRPMEDYRGENTPRDFARIPAVGEYVATAVAGPWYRVRLVVHAPFSAEYEAEIYAVEVDHNAVLRAEWLPHAEQQYTAADREWLPGAEEPPLAPEGAG
jgi:hypothetical protein